MTSEDVLKKVKKLLAHAESAGQVGSEEEAEAFAKKAEELLTKYKLTMSDVEWAELDENDPIGSEFVDPAEWEGLGKRRKQRRAWQERLANAVARAHYCKILVHKGSNIVTFIGRESDREIAIYVYVRLMEGALRLAKRDYRKARREGLETKGFLTSWWNGYVNTIASRSREARRAREERLREDDKSTALVRLKDALTEVNEWAEDEFNIRSAGSIGAPSRNRHGHSRGTEAGAKANLRGDGLREGSTQDQIPGQ